MLDHVKSPVLALVLLVVLPVSSVRSMMLGRVGNPVLALELSQRYKSKAYVVSERIIYALSCLYLFGSVLVLVEIAFLSLGIHDFSDDLDLVRWVSPFDLRHSEMVQGVGDYLDLTWKVMWLDFEVFLVLLVFFVVPVLAATSVVGERQRGTLMLVQLSLLRRFDIVWGKVVASIVLVLFPVGVWVFTIGLFFLRMLLEVSLSMTEAVWMVSYTVLVGLGLLLIVFAVSAVSVMIATFVKSGAAAGVTAIAVNCGMAALFATSMPVPSSFGGTLSRLLSLCVFLVTVVILAVLQAWARLDLPAGK